MRKIYVLDDNNQPQLIDAGITEYKELKDVPISRSYNGVDLLYSTVSSQNEELVITPLEKHRWSEDELLTFCSLVDDGRYDVLTQLRGYEILLVDSTDEQRGRRLRRIGVSQDDVYDSIAEQWASITDTEYDKLIVKFLNEKDIPSSVVVGDPFILKFYYYSSMGTGRVNVTMNGATFTVGTVTSGQTIDVDLTNRIVDGNNSILVSFSNAAVHNQLIPEIAVNGINITYTPDFNQFKPYSDNIPFNYSCSGSSNKIIYFELENTNGEVTTLEVPHESGYFGAYATLPASAFSHGENYIRTYMVAINENGQEIARTVTTTYKIPFLVSNNPLLMVYFDAWNDLKQYASISLPYYVWRKSEGVLDEIKFAMESDAISNGSIQYSYSSDDPGAAVNYLQYNQEHKWLISSLPTSYVGKEDKKMRFTIQGIYGEYSTNKFIKDNVTIVSSSSAMQTVPGYKFNFAATDLTRATDEWVATGTTPVTMQLSNFNWNTDGIQIDAEGNQTLHFASAATAKLVENKNPLFGAYDQQFTLELSFKVDKSAANEPIIKYYDPVATNPSTYGLFIYPNKALFKFKGGSSEINYIAGERTHLAYVVCKKTITDKDLDKGGIKSGEVHYLFVYLNGILSQIKEIVSNVEFPSQCGTIEFNTNHNDFDLYAFRGYANSLSSAQVLQNYISTIGDASIKEATYLRNAVYNESLTTGVIGEYEVDFNKVKGTIPCYVMVMDVLPRDKNYKDVLGIYYEKEGETNVEPGGWVKKMNQDLTGIPKATTYYYYREQVKDEEGNIIPNQYTAWTRNKPIEVGGQGTSSMAYPRHNFKFKHNKNNKFYIKGHTHGPDRTFTFKADYMDSSGANNIGNAQVLDNAIVRSKWITTRKSKDENGEDVEIIIPTPAYEGARVNLDGFPVAVFWCESKDLKGGVVQDENATDVFDHKGKPLYDAIKPNAQNPLVGEVTPLNPKYLGTFNFNYDKKAKKLLGWNENNFQGFEFRGNSSNCNLFRGFENFAAFTSLGEGFEWRWTYCSDYIDDFHDGHLSVTIDGGYVKEIEIKDKTTIVRATEAEYLAGDADKIPAYNQFFIERNGEKLQLMLENEDSSYSPINYITINPLNANWKLSDCSGICSMQKDGAGKDASICLEYGVKIGEKDGVLSFLYQKPYGIDYDTNLGLAYADGSHYYDFKYNPEHEFKFELNTKTAKFFDDEGKEHDYYADEEFWDALAPLSKVKAKKISYSENPDGLYVFDEDEEDYFLKASYEEGTDFSGKVSYDQQIEYLDVTAEDKVITWDFMKEVMKNWCYVNEAVAHYEGNNPKELLDSNIKWGDNGYGLFIWDALTNYMAASIITGLCDNFAKNMFMHSYDGGLTWSPAWYDMDTCFGLNNEGAYTKMYDIDFMDKDSTGARAFNGSNSKLWELIYNDCFIYVKDMYKYLRSQNYISYDKIMEVIDNGNIAYKSEALYNANAVFRYIEPKVWHNNNKSDAAQGNRLQLLKYWNSNRQTFLDSRYEAGGWTGDTINLRLNNTTDFSFNLIPDTNMFVGANLGGNDKTVPEQKSPSKILAGQSYSYTVQKGKTNQEHIIFGASHLLEVGDLSLCNSTEYSLVNAVNLRKIKIGDEVHPPRVTTILTLSGVSQYNNLKLLDLTNTTLKNSNLNLVLGDGRNLVPALQELKLKGSNIEDLTLASYTPLTYLSLSSTLKDIILKNLLTLENLEIGEMTQLESITIQNCPLVNQHNVLKKFINATITIDVDNLQIPEEEAVEEGYMNWLMDKNAKLAGNIYVQSTADSRLDKYREKWPNLTINLHQVYEDAVVFGVSGEGE